MSGIDWLIWKSKKALIDTKSQAFTLTLGNTPYLLPGSEQTDREILAIYNASDSIIYIGGADVTVNNGFPVASSKYFIIPAVKNIYAICGSAGKSIRLLELK